MSTRPNATNAGPYRVAGLMVESDDRVWGPFNHPDALYACHAINFAHAQGRASAVAALWECVKAMEAAIKATGTEFLYQTGQYCRPGQQYPKQATVHGALSDAADSCRAAIATAKKVLG